MDGDATHDELSEAFFAAGEDLRSDEDELCFADAWYARKMTAAAHARRVHLARYVRWTVGAAMALLVLGITVDAVRKNRVELPSTSSRSEPP
jgi:hypothetical protein